MDHQKKQLLCVRIAIIKLKLLRVQQIKSIPSEQLRRILATLRHLEQQL